MPTQRLSPAPFTRVAVRAVAMLVGSACHREPERCAICFMPIPPETRAVVSVDGGKPRVTCDPRCPLTFREQTGRSVGLTLVTDFESGAGLDPSSAFFVTGSDLAPDAHTAAIRATPNDAAYLHWHRCLPSVLAFRTREAAARFQQQHGGTATTLTGLGFATPH